MSEFYYHCDEKLYPMDNMKILIASSPTPLKCADHRHTHFLDILMTNFFRFLLRCCTWNETYLNHSKH